VAGRSPEQIATWLGLDPSAPGLVSCDVFDGVLVPGDIILMLAWKTQAAADGFNNTLPASGRRRQVRVIRDYGMYDRHESPQYYPAVDTARTTDHR
jgi:hypothetical protein